MRVDLIATLLLATLLDAGAVRAHESDEPPIHSGSELLDWCRQESESRFLGEGRRASNWTAKHHERGNELRVVGHWRVDGERHRVTCRVARGAPRRYAHLGISRD
jgi:hypothetical protein